MYSSDKDEYRVVDYNATAKSEVVLDLPEWADGYRRQSEIYQWLLRKNGLIVSDTAYNVYCTGDVNAGAFGGTLTFHQEVIPYERNDSWVDGVLDQLQACLASDQIPTSSEDCEYCKFKMAK